MDFFDRAKPQKRTFANDTENPLNSVDTGEQKSMSLKKGKIRDIRLPPVTPKLKLLRKHRRQPTNDDISMRIEASNDPLGSVELTKSPDLAAGMME